MNYREVAETIRVARAYDKNRYKLVQNLLMKSHLNQWRIVYLMYASSSKHRLSDEDLREIYFKLTDLYPEEVEENPDIIGLLSELSRAKKTVAITDRVMDITKKVLDPSITNTERAALLRPVFFRVERQDLSGQVGWNRGASRRISWMPVSFRQEVSIAPGSWSINQALLNE